MDRSSIFRTLKTFEENKVIHSIEDGSGMTKYAVCAEGCNCDPKDLHYHFYCTNCDKTFCLFDVPIPNIQLPKNFKLQQANMVPLLLEVAAQVNLLDRPLNTMFTKKSV